MPQFDQRPGERLTSDIRDLALEQQRGAGFVVAHRQGGRGLLRGSVRDVVRSLDGALGTVPVGVGDLLD
ncbi:hypothetical protein D9M72_643220 [compost metagenome]